MSRRFELCLRGLAALLLLVALPAGAQSFRVQCPTSTNTHPIAANNVAEPGYKGATTLAPGAGGYLMPPSDGSTVNGAIKCQQITGGDGYATMADGTQIYLFAFGPASGLYDIARGLPGTQTPDIFNAYYGANATFPYAQGGAVPVPGDPATTDSVPGTGAVNLSNFTFNGAIGLAQDVTANASIFDISEGLYPACAQPVLVGNQTLPTNVPAPPASIAVAGAANNPTGIATAGIGSTVVTVVLNTPSPFKQGDTVVISGTGGTPAHGGYDGSWPVTATGLYNWCYSASAVNQTQYQNGSSYAFTISIAQTGVTTPTGLAELSSPNDNTSMVAAAPAGSTNTGHIDPRQLMDVAVMNGNQPAPLLAIDEDDEFFLTLSNVGMIMRPDLFEQHTVHFHGYPNASSFYDGVPDASVAIAIAASFTYYYLAPDAGSYFYHCHITPPEHLQMGMVGQLYVRPRQNRWSGDLYAGLLAQQSDLRTACSAATDFECSNPLPAINTGKTSGIDLLGNPQKYVYNDGDGTTAYDVEYPVQQMAFDPNFHFVGMTFNGEGFKDMKDKYFLLNGRGYPDTVTPGPMSTPSSDGVKHFSQPIPAIINIPVGGKAALRISQLTVADYMTLQTIGIPMTVVGWNAKLLRDQSGNNMYYLTNSITTGGGESADVILDASDTTKYSSGQVFYLYSANLDQLSNDAENFGGLMTEIHICKSVTNGSTFGNTCNL